MAWSVGNMIRPGEYIQSPSQLYFAILESSGDLVVYRGASPGDVSKQKVWNSGSGSKQAGEEVYAIFYPTEENIRDRNNRYYGKQIHLSIGIINSARLLWVSPNPGGQHNSMFAFVDDDGRFGLREGAQTFGTMASPIQSPSIYSTRANMTFLRV